jgi:hypothetical protein
MNKGYKNGAVDVGIVTAKVLNAVGDEKEVVAKLMEGLPDAVREIAFGFSVIYGGKARDDMPPEGKALLITALHKILASGSASELAYKYFEHFFALLDVDPLPDFDAKKLSLLKGQNAEYALYVILEYKAFFEHKAFFRDKALKKADEIAKNLSVSANRREEFEQCIKGVVDDTSLQVVLNKYDLQLLLSEKERWRKEMNARICE